jgi:hypothetical protein
VAASAQGAPVAPEAMTRARALFDAGAKAFEAGDYEAAIQAFEQAHKVVPRDNLVFSLAQAHRRQYIASGDTAHLKAAIDHYRRYVAAVKAGGRRAEAIKALEELDAAARGIGSGPAPATPDDAAAPAVAKQKTRIWINSRTPEATFTVDGGVELPVGQAVEVSPGKHTVRFSAKGYVDQEVTVDAVEGELVPESLDLKARPARLQLDVDAGTSVFVDGRFVGEAPLPDDLDLPPGRHYVSLSLRGHRSEGIEVPLAGGESKRVAADLVSTGQRDVSWGFLVTGGVFLTASGVFFGVAAARHSDADQIFQDHQTQNLTTREVQKYDSIVAQRDRFAVAASATGVVGVIVGLVGAGLYVFDDATPLSVPRDLEEDRPATPTLAPSLELSAQPLVGPDLAAGVLSGAF